MTPQQKQEQYSWTPEGLRLLQTIENEIMQSGGQSAVIHTIERQNLVKSCYKKDCHYCRLTTPYPKADLPEVLIINMRANRKLAKNRWTINEDKIILNNLASYVDDIMLILPGRTRKAIFTRRYTFRYIQGVKIRLPKRA